MQFLKSPVGQRPAISVILLACFLVPVAFAQDQPASPDAVPFSPQSPDQVASPQTPVIGGDAKPADKSSDQADQSQGSAIKLGPGDLVEVGVYGVPELTTKARVSNDGDLYLPLIDYVHVGDLSLEESQKLIEKRLDDGGYVKNPHVTIFVNDYASQGVTLMGEIGKPGIYPVLGDRKLFDLFSAAGGLTDRASRTVSITRRNRPDNPELLHLARNLTDKPESNIRVWPGDTIEIFRAPIVYIVGDVGRPSGLLVDNGSLTVLQAIALAGGPNRTAKLNGTRIIRKSNGPNGMTETVVPLKKMLQAKAPDVPLQANDILFVPVSGAKVVTARAVETAMALTTAVAIYAVHP
jgi:polysaccharide export outer membrane protein